MPPRVPELALALAVVVGCLALTSTAAALALQRPHLEWLDTDTGSQLKADYSADPRRIRIAPLDPAIIEAAASDEETLTTTAPAPRRAEVGHMATAAPGEPARSPVPTGEPSATPTRPTAPVARTTAETATPSPPPAEASPPPVATTTSAPLEPTATPRVPTEASTPTPPPAPTATAKPAATTTPGPQPATPVPTPGPPTATPTPRPPTATPTPGLPTATPTPAPSCSDPDPTNGYVLSITPPDGATGVSVSTKVIVRFDQAMNPATISTATIVLSAFQPGSGSIPAVVTYDSSTHRATLDPDEELEGETTFRVKVMPSVENACGTKQGRLVKTFFTTAP